MSGISGAAKAGPDAGKGIRTEIGAAEGESPEAIFRRGSRTYYNSSKFFPKEFRDKVTTLYAFVRSADDYVDSTPQDAAGFAALRRRWDLAAAAAFDAGRGGQEPVRSAESTGDPIVDRFAALAAESGFERAWVEAFLDAMEADLSVRSYDTLEATLSYVYGSAEVVGLFMARLMDLPSESYRAARALGRAMQYVNFVRDFAEDRRLGRRYLPLDGADPSIADEIGARAHPEAFSSFLRRHIDMYRSWAAEGRAGFAFIPARFRAPIATAMDMYDWTAARVAERPMAVWERALKPSKPRIALAALKNLAARGRA